MVIQQSEAWIVISVLWEEFPFWLARPCITFNSAIFRIVLEETDKVVLADNLPDSVSVVLVEGVVEFL